jgi:hypothetical protein
MHIDTTHTHSCYPTTGRITSLTLASQHCRTTCSKHTVGSPKVTATVRPSRRNTTACNTAQQAYAHTPVRCATWRTTAADAHHSHISSKTDAASRRLCRTHTNHQADQTATKPAPINRPSFHDCLATYEPDCSLPKPPQPRLGTISGIDVRGLRGARTGSKPSIAALSDTVCNQTLPTSSNT